MSILSKRANATARHEIDSKLKTMRTRITENSAEKKGGVWVEELPHSIFSVKHAIYIRITLKLLEEIFPKPSAHSWKSFSSPSVTKQTLVMILNRYGSGPRFGEK